MTSRQLLAHDFFPRDIGSEETPNAKVYGASNDLPGYKDCIKMENNLTNEALRNYSPTIPMWQTRGAVLLAQSLDEIFHFQHTLKGMWHL